MTERKRRPARPARYYEDQFVFTSSGRRLSELTDEELLIYDPSRAPEPPPLPGQQQDKPGDS